MTFARGGGIIEVMSEAIELDVGELLGAESEKELQTFGHRKGWNVVARRRADRVSRRDIKTRAYLRFKRAFDFVFAGVALVLCVPVFALVALAIKLDPKDKGPVFYKHKRVGKNGKPIYLYKFRTMREGADKELEKLLEDPKIRKEWEANYKLEKDPRVTRVGKLLRKTSLDELPQLLNILKGDMSLVGPRPLVEEEIEKYGRDREKFLSVTPGITGWWACNGRSEIDYEERMDLELYYVDNVGLKIDVKTILRTISVVVRGIGAR